MYHDRTVGGPDDRSAPLDLGLSLMWIPRKEKINFYFGNAVVGKRVFVRMGQRKEQRSLNKKKGGDWKWMTKQSPAFRGETWV